MNKYINNTSNSVKSNSKLSKEQALQNLVLETLQNFDVNIKDSKELKFLSFDISKYQQNQEKSVFGEKLSLLYKFNFITYNVEYEVKLLVFQYDNKMQILKLDIEPQNAHLKKELEYYCNFLRRRRNLNLMFSGLILFSRTFEARRLICDLILKKDSNVRIDQNKDGGIIIVYSNEQTSVKFGVIWNIVCSSSQDITDVVEVYYKDFEPFIRDTLKEKLTQLTHPTLNFSVKYHLWKELFHELSEMPVKCLRTRHNKIPNNEQKPLLNSVDEIMDTSEAEGVILLSDSEDGGSNSVLNVLPSNNTFIRVVPDNRLINNVIERAVCSLFIPQTSSDNLRSLYVPQKSIDVSQRVPDEIPAKRCRIGSGDDDLEITSITYVVPD